MIWPLRHILITVLCLAFGLLLVGYYSLSIKVIRSTDDSDNHPLASRSPIIMESQVADSSSSPASFSQNQLITEQPPTSPKPIIVDWETEDPSTIVVPTNGTTLSTPNLSIEITSTTINYSNTSEIQITTTASPTTLKPTENQPLPSCPEYINGSGIAIPCWLLREGTCYCFSIFRAKWSEARKWCGDSNDIETSNLVSFDEINEFSDVYYNHVNTFPQLKGYPYWTSGRYNTTSESWEWSNLNTQGGSSDEKPNAINIANTGSNGNFDRYLYNNRNKNPKGSCLVLNSRNGGEYSARFCSNAYRFICKRSLKVMLEST